MIVTAMKFNQEDVMVESKDNTIIISKYIYVSRFYQVDQTRYRYTFLLCSKGKKYEILFLRDEKSWCKAVISFKVSIRRLHVGNHDVIKSIAQLSYLLKINSI